MLLSVCRHCIRKVCYRVRIKKKFPCNIKNRSTFFARLDVILCFFSMKILTVTEYKPTLGARTDIRSTVE